MAPLFPGYIFCQFDAQKRLPILVTPGVVGVVGRGRIPVPIEDSEIAAIPAKERRQYLLQERVKFEPVIRTPEGMTQAEIRILYLWPDGGKLTPAISLVRLGRGKMMGVDHNRNQEWVGASAAFWR